MSEEAKSGIAASRALYFSELQERGETEGVARVKRPSYVGISNSLNGYTPYAPYRTAQDYGRKISPPLHFPPQLPPSLDSVSLVLTQDGFQKSLQEFQDTMRDINMGRPESADITDNGSIMTGSEEFYPRSHIKQVIENGDSKSVHTLTQFHSSHSTQGKPNLVSKQIERLYGSDSLAQVRLTSPEPQDRSPGSIGSPARNGSPDFTPPERKLSGGFFSKRFGITKMKDHSTLPAVEQQKEIRPIKVPAVFKLLRPEFREQLKQSSCKVLMPDEQGKERIIPIQLESTPTSPTSTRPTPSPRPSYSTPGSKYTTSQDTTPVSRSSERIIPITRLSNGDLNGHTLINGTNGHSNGSSPFVNGFGSKGFGVSRRSVPNVIGFRGSNEKASDKDIPAKPLVIRKLSPLSPKHIVVPSSSKPAPAPKPEYLMSPPMSPVPSEENRSPALSRTNSLPPTSPGASSPAHSSTPVPSASPVPPVSSISPLPGVEAEANEEPIPVADDNIPEMENLSLGVEGKREVENIEAEAKNPETEEEFEDASPEEMEEVSEKDMDIENYRDQEVEEEKYQEYYGLRERELLCPILEEDNESTASGSLCNLQNNSGIFTPEDQLLEQGEHHDGVHFIKVLENEMFKFEEQICDFEEELSISCDIPEECRENILSTVGLAKLLMAQKLAQFRGLCDKNIHVSKEEDPFVPTNQDLAGFWDMVHIQIEQVHGKFADLQKLRAEGWVIKVPEVLKVVKKGVNKKVNKPIKPKEKSEAALARDLARKKMMEARKKAMKMNQEESDLIIIM